MATTKTSDKSENAITKQENSWLNFDRKHMQHFLQTEASLRSNKQTWNQWKSSQLSTGDHPRPRGPVGSTAVLSLRWDNKKIRKQVAFIGHKLFWGQCDETSTSGGNVKIYDNIKNLSSNLVSNTFARDESVLTQFSSGHRIATASEKGTVIRWRIYVLCSSCTEQLIID